MTIILRHAKGTVWNMFLVVVVAELEELRGDPMVVLERSQEMVEMKVDLVVLGEAL
jgi:hypothetical protein